MQKSWSEMKMKNKQTKKDLKEKEREEPETTKH